MSEFNARKMIEDYATYPWATIIEKAYERGKADVLAEQKEYLEYIMSILTDEQLVLVAAKGKELKEQI